MAVYHDGARYAHPTVHSRQLGTEWKLIEDECLENAADAAVFYVNMCSAPAQHQDSVRIGQTPVRHQWACAASCYAIV